MKTKRKWIELKKREHVKAVVISANTIGTKQQSSFGEFTGNHNLIVTDFTEEEKVNFELEEGRLPEKVNEVVVGSHFADALNEATR